MTTKHTQGNSPWEFDQSKKYYQKDVIRMNGVLICQMIKQATMSDNEYQANARLIPAAPALLAAAERMVAQINGQSYLTHTGDCACAGCELQNAIALATDERPSCS